MTAKVRNGKHRLDAA